MDYRIDDGTCINGLTTIPVLGQQRILYQVHSSFPSDSCISFKYIHFWIRFPSRFCDVAMIRLASAWIVQEFTNTSEISS